MQGNTSINEVPSGQLPDSQPAVVVNLGSERSERESNQNPQPAPFREVTVGPRRSHHLGQVGPSLSGSNRSHSGLQSLGKVFGALTAFGTIVAIGVVAANCEARHVNDRGAANSCYEKDGPMSIGIVVATSLCLTGVKAFQSIRDRRSLQNEINLNRERVSIFFDNTPDERTVSVDLLGADSRPIEIVPQSARPASIHPSPDPTNTTRNTMESDSSTINQIWVEKVVKSSQPIEV